MWYALVQDEQLGPMPAHEVQQLFEQKVIVGDTLVWRAGMNDWVALCQLPEFMHLFSEGDKTVAADFDTLFGELDEDDRTMLGDPAAADVDLGAAVDALLDDGPDEPAPAADDDADEMTIGAPAPPMSPPGRAAPPSPFGNKGLPSPFGKPPASSLGKPLASSLGKPPASTLGQSGPAPLGARKPAPPAPLGGRKPAPPALAPRSGPSAPAGGEEGTMELGEADLFGDLLAEAGPAPGAEPLAPPAPEMPAGATMELGEADLFGDLLEEVAEVEELESLDELEPVEEPVAAPPSPFGQPAAPVPPSPFGQAAAPAPPAPSPFAQPAAPDPYGAPADIDFGAAAEPDADLGYGAPVDPAASPFGPGGPRVTSAAIEPEGAKKNPLLIALLLVLVGGGIGVGVLALIGTGEQVEPDAAPPPPIVDAAPPVRDAAVPDAAPVVDAAPVPDAARDAVVDAVVDAAPPPPDARKPAPPVNRRRWKPPPPPPPPPPSDKPVQLSRDDIQAVVNGASGTLSACAAEVPALKSKTVSVHVTINRNGRIARTRVISASLRGTPAEGCVENALKALRFPEFTGDPMNFPLPIKL